MSPTGRFGRKHLPRAIPPQELQDMLQANPAFCSRHAFRLKACDPMQRWPFLFSHPRMGTEKKLAE